MITEDYVGFEIAKLLKEKGFDWECYAHYNLVEQAFEEYSVTVISHTNKNSTLGPFWISAPTQQMACDWLEETHGLFIKIGRSMDINSNYYYIYNVLDKDNTGQITSIRPSKEEAIESALEYALTKLI